MATNRRNISYLSKLKPIEDIFKNIIFYQKGFNELTTNYIKDMSKNNI